MARFKILFVPIVSIVLCSSLFVDRALALIVNPSFNDKVVNAADRNNLQLLKELIERQKMPVDSVGDFGATPLIRASYRGNERIVSYLISQNADVNIGDLGGETALHIASREGHLPIVQMLVNSGANLETQDVDGWTPLMRATLRGRDKVVQLIIASGASVGAMNRWGETPILLSSKIGNADIVKLLVSKEKDLNQLTSAQEFARRYGHEEVVSILEKTITDVKKSSLSNVRSPLQYQNGTKNVNQVALENSQGANVIASTKLENVHTSAIQKIGNNSDTNSINSTSSITQSGSRIVSVKDKVRILPQKMVGAIKGFGGKLFKPFGNERSSENPVITAAKSDDLQKTMQAIPDSAFKFSNTKQPSMRDVFQKKQIVKPLNDDVQVIAKQNVRDKAQTQNMDNSASYTSQRTFKEEPIQIFPVAVGGKQKANDNQKVSRFVVKNDASEPMAISNISASSNAGAIDFSKQLSEKMDPDLPWKSESPVKQQPKVIAESFDSIKGFFARGDEPIDAIARSSSVKVDKPIYQLKLADADNIRKAQKYSQSLKEKYSGTLSQHNFEIISANEGKSYEVRSGIFKDVSEAKTLCDELNAKDQRCSVIRTNEVSSLSIEKFLGASDAPGIVTLVTN